MGVDLPSPTVLDYALVLVVFVVTAAPYLNSLEGNMCYDDKVAVGGNPDVVMPNVTLWDIATHDFWGNDILRRRCGALARTRARARARQSRAPVPQSPPLPPLCLAGPAAGRTTRGGPS